VEDALEHHVDHVVELLGGEFVEGERARPGLDLAGVGEHDVEPAEALDRAVHGLGDVGFAGHVDPVGDRRAALAVDLGGDVDRPLLDQVGHRDGSPGVGPPQRAFATQTGPAAGDEDDLLVEAHGISSLRGGA
jgi:hypothetical protein